MYLYAYESLDETGTMMCVHVLCVNKYIHAWMDACTCLLLCNDLYDYTLKDLKIHVCTWCLIVILILTQIGGSKASICMHLINKYLSKMLS